MPNSSNWSDEEDGQAADSNSCIIVDNSQDATNGTWSGPTLNKIIKALRKVQKTLSQERIRSHQRTSAHANIGWVINQIQALKKNSNRDNEEEPEPSPTDDNSRLANIEKELAEIKKAVTDPRKTYAQAAQQATPNITERTHIEIAKRERLEKIRKEQAKTTVTLSLHTASKDLQETLESTPEDRMIETIQTHIMEHLHIPSAPIRTVKRTSKQTIKLFCNSEADATSLRNLNWETALCGAKAISATYAIVIHGVSKQDIDTGTQSQETIKASLESINDIDIVRTAPLMKRPRNPNAPTHSIIVFLKSSKEADNCIINGIRIGHRLHSAERYAPQYQVRQCFRCQSYGHIALSCTRQARCGKCAEEHETLACTSNTVKCTHCQEPHYAWHKNCPRHVQETERLELLRATTSPTYEC